MSRKLLLSLISLSLFCASCASSSNASHDKTSNNARLSGRSNSSLANSSAESRSFSQARAAWVEEDYPAAISQFESFVRLYPSSEKVGEAYLLTGLAQIDKGEAVVAAAHLQKAVNHSQNSRAASTSEAFAIRARALRALAELSLLRNDFQSALNQASKALDNSQEIGLADSSAADQSRLLMAKSLYGLGKGKQASRLLEIVSSGKSHSNVQLEASLIRYLEGGYTVQLGAFGKSENAMSLLKTLRASGFSGEIVQLSQLSAWPKSQGSESLFRVFSGLFASRKEAQMHARKIRKASSKLEGYAIP